ncbi:MAG: Gx transporter family protein [Clostridia bacterium]|nr:Gx transporter family protein [Clostridia bacterium]
MKPASDKRVVRIAENAAFLSVALILSFVESFLPTAILPLPGFKIGLANLAILSVFYRTENLADAAVISLCRCLITFLLFGNVTSLLFSLCGGAMVIGMLALAGRMRGLSFIGVSVLCAAAHNAGQLLAAVLLTGTAVLAYMPALFAASAFYGTVNGVILNLMPEFITNNTKNK